jgi:hypothetical protein
MFKYVIPDLMLVAGLSLSAIAAWYSILGAKAIFVGGGISVLLLFGFLELAKISATLGLKKYWKKPLGIIRYILIGFIVLTMGVTALGTFGYLSKAAQSQSESVNVNSAKVVFLEESIQREKFKLDNINNQVAQYNDLLTKLIAKDIRTASSERKRIQAEIKRLNKESGEISASIDKINAELLPFKTEVKQLEVEIGPLLFISKFVYGDDYKSHTDDMLMYLIILIVCIFDPFALTLLIMSQKAYDFSKDKEEPAKPEYLGEFRPSYSKDVEKSGFDTEVMREVAADPEKSKQFLVDAGIIDEDGKLTPEYNPTGPAIAHSEDEYRGLESAYDEPQSEWVDDLYNGDVVKNKVENVKWKECQKLV